MTVVDKLWLIIVTALPPAKTPLGIVTPPLVLVTTLPRSLLPNVWAEVVALLGIFLKSPMLSDTVPANVAFCELDMVKAVVAAVARISESSLCWYLILPLLLALVPSAKNIEPIALVPLTIVIPIWPKSHW